MYRMLSLAPLPPLGLLVQRLWDWRVDAPWPAFALDRVLPGPEAGIIINLAEDETRTYADERGTGCERRPGSVFRGTHTHSQLIDSAEQVAVMGVVFRPGAAAPFVRERMDLLCNREVGLDTLFGHRAGLLRE